MSTALVPVNGEIVRRETTDNFMPALTIEDAIRRKRAIVEFVQQLMIDGTDYGNVPGSTKPTLLKPGAEKLCSYFGLVPRYTALSVTKDWTGKDHNNEPFFEFDYKCRLVRLNDETSVVGEGDGSCNSWESKYRYRDSKRACPACGKSAIIKGKEEWGGGWLCHKKQGGCGAKYQDKDPAITTQQVGRIPNPDVFDQVNTFEKMAQKRAHIAATLNAVNASEFYTQDLDPEEPHWEDSGSKEAADAVAQRTIDQLKQGKEYREIKAEAGAISPDLSRADGTPPQQSGARPTKIAANLRASNEAVKPVEAQRKPFTIATSCQEFAKLKQMAVDKLGPDRGNGLYYRILGSFGAEHANDLKSAKPAREAYRAIAMEIDAALSSKTEEDDFDRHVQQEAEAGR